MEQKGYSDLPERQKLSESFEGLQRYEDFEQGFPHCLGEPIILLFQSAANALHRDAHVISHLDRENNLSVHQSQSDVHKS